MRHFLLLLICLPVMTFGQTTLFSYDFGTSYISSLTGTGQWCGASPNSNTSSYYCSGYGWFGDYSTKYITTRAISIPSSATSANLSFNYKYNGFSSPPTVGVSTSCTGTFTTLATLSYSFSCTSQNIDLSAYCGQTIYIRFDANNSSSYQFVIDDVLVTASTPTTLWSQDFTTTSYDMGSNSSFTRNAGNSYACASGNYVFYTSSTNARFQTNTFSVPQNKGIKLAFDSYRTSSSSGIIRIYYNITGYCSFNYSSPNDNGWVKWGEITPNTGTGLGNCTRQSLSLESFICGGQNISVCLWCPTAGSTYRISIDNIAVTDDGPTSVPTPIITVSTPYVENFNSDLWYGPASVSFLYGPAGNVIPYKSRKSASDAYVYLWSNGANNTGNHSGVWGNYCAAFFTGYDFCGTTGGSQIITKELNTSLCANPMVKYGWRWQYPCGGTDYDNTFDEDYTTYTPELYSSIGQGYTWVQRPVNYYFPDGLWHYASYSVPSAANIKLRFVRGGFCTDPVEAIDDIEVFCEDCRISELAGGTITGEPNPSINTDYTYTITSTLYATYYKWMIRCLDRTPPVVIDAACPNGTDPCIVSGQGTQTVVINFGSHGGEDYRVMCIPYDADPGTLEAPSDACYAAISLFPTTLPVEWGYFLLNEINGEILLKWQTLSETNNHRFEIQKSFDSEFFNTIATIPGAGNSNIAVEYSFLDENSETGTTYYRIRQVDYDGKESFSKVLSVINENPT
ncbi:MAG TPA: hypothetical protein PK855_09935, partial [Bacteroidales bacterium]|nr:hypothetical protein [Bacteroidales bacterium]